jgi:hypothetical protein
MRGKEVARVVIDSLLAARLPLDATLSYYA